MNTLHGGQRKRETLKNTTDQDPPDEMSTSYEVVVSGGSLGKSAFLTNILPPLCNAQVCRLQRGYIQYFTFANGPSFASSEQWHFISWIRILIWKDFWNAGKYILGLLDPFSCYFKETSALRAEDNEKRWGEMFHLLKRRWNFFHNVFFMPYFTLQYDRSELLKFWKRIFNCQPVKILRAHERIFEIVSLFLRKCHHDESPWSQWAFCWNDLKLSPHAILFFTGIRHVCRALNAAAWEGTRITQGFLGISSCKRKRINLPDSTYPC